MSEITKYFFLIIALALICGGVLLIFNDKYAKYMYLNFWKIDDKKYGVARSGQEIERQRYIKGFGSVMVGMAILLWLSNNW